MNDLRFVAGPTLVQRVALLNKETYEGSARGPISTTRERFETSRFEAMKWTASWRMEPATQRPLYGDAVKVFVEIAPGGLAQVTPAVAARDTVVARLIETLGTTSAPDCYWPLPRNRYPGLFPEHERRKAEAERDEALTSGAAHFAPREHAHGARVAGGPRGSDGDGAI